MDRKARAQTASTGDDGSDGAYNGEPGPAYNIEPGPSTRTEEREDPVAEREDHDNDNIRASR